MAASQNRSSVKPIKRKTDHSFGHVFPRSFSPPCEKFEAKIVPVAKKKTQLSKESQLRGCVNSGFITKDKLNKFLVNCFQHCDFIILEFYLVRCSQKKKLRKKAIQSAILSPSENYLIKIKFPIRLAASSSR